MKKIKNIYKSSEQIFLATDDGKLIFSNEENKFLIIKDKEKLKKIIKN